ncbi:hypothetical protein vseg_010827 [Gypsophila vaccaria]
MASSFSFSRPTCYRLHSTHSRRRTSHVAGVSPYSEPNSVSGISLFSGRRRKCVTILPSAASRGDSKSKGDIESEKDDLEQAGKASQEAWEQILHSFKEQALKLQSVSQEAYEVYSKKAAVALKETAQTLKIQADQARRDMLVMAQELGEDRKQYLNVAAENSLEPVKDVVETFASAEDLDDVAKVRDFYVGIPYGTVLSAGGFLNFMITGSISAIRFGVILGGVLLGLSVSSLRSWKRGQSTELTLKGQAAIAGILFLRDVRLIFQGPTLFGLLKAVISGAVATFFVYRIIYDNPQSRPWIDGETQS